MVASRYEALQRGEPAASCRWFGLAEQRIRTDLEAEEEELIRLQSRREADQASRESPCARDRSQPQPDRNS